jgi:carbon-monoxide dehydrogenase large subunit
MPLDKAGPFALADGEVSYVGEPVAMVLADDRYIAEDAAALVAVGLRNLAVRRRRTHRERNPRRSAGELASNVITTYKVEFGDVAGVREGPPMYSSRSCGSTAARRIRSRRADCSPELRQADGGITVHASTQKAHDLQQTLSSLMEFDQSLRVVAPDIAAASAPSSASIPRTSP